MADGMGLMDQAAITAHETFMAFLRAGFTEPQALTLVSNIMTANLSNPQESDDD